MRLRTAGRAGVVDDWSDRRARQAAECTNDNRVDRLVYVDDYDDDVFYSIGSAAKAGADERLDSSQALRLALTASLPISKTSGATALFLMILIFRLAHALLLRTFFQPDEYWQSQEIAHHIVFGYGYRTWEWKSSVTIANSLHSAGGRVGAWQGLLNGPIRSIAHALAFVPGYWLLKLCKLDNTVLLTMAPRLTQAIFAAFGDFYTFKLARRIVSPLAAYVTLLLTAASPYALYTSVRTFSNTLEANLTVIALYYWPLTIAHPDYVPHERYCKCDSDEMRNSRGAKASEARINEDKEMDDDDPGGIRAQNMQRSITRLGLLLSAVAFVVRPTNALVWLYVVARYVPLQMKRATTASQAIENAITVGSLVVDAVVIGCAVLLASIALDSIYYGRIVLTPLTFLQRNVLQSVSLFYGSHPWHFYLFQALPVLCLAFLPYTLLGWARAMRLDTSKAMMRYPEKVALKIMAEMAMFIVTVYSLLGHKEFRFLQPILPLLHIFAAYSLTRKRLLKGVKATAAGTTARTVAERTSPELAPTRTRSIVEKASSSHPSGLATLSTAVRAHFCNVQLAWQQLGTARWPLPAQVLILIQLPLSAYLMLFHCVGQESIMRDLRQMHHEGLTGAIRGRAPIKSVGFLMPCHSTPWQSSLHLRELELEFEGVHDTLAGDAQARGSVNGAAEGRSTTRNSNTSGDLGRAWFITCEPPRSAVDLLQMQAGVYQDLSDVFYADPVGFLKSYFPRNVDPSFPPMPRKLEHAVATQVEGLIPWPSHLVMFEALLAQCEKTGTVENQGWSLRGGMRHSKTVESLLEDMGYKVAFKRWNSLKHEDSRRNGKIVVWEWRA
ncbi:glycosyltransferase family 22 protein [Tilletiaria anomala UBC 951]|uniref:Mannosyltransferase n=1 Tax=Tilletiaria anomala (strain ATCC 24038 / CBS 436.72 / UBC 951) TaxID=1037660 RepID=A0A066VU44_TILAU|nr:glycosyltransferase family 22 protein [Tilletiaria anomala UBC 951]KDN42090.1 glycosyltransferase family 22 protein [Tilletiaria anomala UBC 951]